MILAGAFALWRRRLRRRHAAAGLAVPAAKRSFSGVDGATVEVAIVGSPTAALTTPRQRGSPPRSAFAAAPASRSSVSSSCAGFRPAGQEKASHGSAAGLAAAPSALPLLPSDPSSSGVTKKSSGSGVWSTAAVRGEASTDAEAQLAAEAAAETAGQAAQLLAQLPPELTEAVVSEADVKFLTGPDGRQITLGTGGFGHV